MTDKPTEGYQWERGDFITKIFDFSKCFKIHIWPESYTRIRKTDVRNRRLTFSIANRLSTRIDQQGQGSACFMSNQIFKSFVMVFEDITHTNRPEMSMSIPFNWRTIDMRFSNFRFLLILYLIVHCNQCPELSTDMEMCCTCRLFIVSM